MKFRYACGKGSRQSPDGDGTAAASLFLAVLRFPVPKRAFLYHPPVWLGDIDGGGPGADQSPPSITRSIRPSMVANRSMPLAQVGWPDMLALVEIRGMADPVHNRGGKLRFALPQPETASVPRHLQRNLCGRRHNHGEGSRPEVPRQYVEAARQVFCEIFRHRYIVDQQRQRTNGFAAFGLKHAAHGMQIERIGDQHVECFGRNPDNLPRRNGARRPANHFITGIIDIYFYKICCHGLSGTVPPKNGSEGH